MNADYSEWAVSYMPEVFIVLRYDERLTRKRFGKVRPMAWFYCVRQGRFLPFGSMGLQACAGQ